MEGTTSLNNPAPSFLACLRNNYLTQHVTAPTRARGSQKPSLLDLVITNEDFVDTIQNLSPLAKSDHSVLYFNCRVMLCCDVNISKLDYNKGQYEELCSYLANDLLESDIFASSGIVCDIGICLEMCLIVV